MRDKRRISFLLILSIMLCLLLPTAAHAEVTNRKVVRVGWFESPYNYSDKNGRRSGYSYEYQQKVAAYTGWQYEYVEASWSELLEMLKTGEIDLLSDVSFTEERSKQMQFSSLPMGTESYYLFTVADNAQIRPGDFYSVSGKKIGVNKNSFQEKLLLDMLSKYSIDAEVVELTVSQDESVEMLRRGEIDGYVTIDTYGEEGVYIPAFKIGQSDFYFAVNNYRRDLLVDLDPAMEKIQDEDRTYNQQLYDRFVRSKGTNSILAAKEVTWLEEHGAVRVGYCDDYMPLCATDNKTGELRGALKDYLELAADCTQNAHIDFDCVPYTTVSDALEALNAGQIDCVFPVNLSAYDGEQLGVSVTTPNMEAEMYAAVRKTVDTESLSTQEMNVAVVEGNLNCETFLKDHFPDWKAVYCADEDEGFRSVSNGNADCMLFSSYRMTRTENMREKYNLTQISTGKTMRFAFAVRKTDNELYYIMNKASGLVPQNSVDSAVLSYSLQKTDFSLMTFLRKHLTLVILTILVFTGLVVLILLRRAYRIKRELEERMKLHDALSTALSEAEEANRAKTSFLSKMSHEIRTPMNAIIGLDTLALRDDTLSDQTRNYLENIGDSAEHLLGLINDILDMSRIESGRLMLRREEFSFSSMLDQINTMVMSQCRDKGLSYECRLLSHVDDSYIGDDMKLKEVLLNILSNSVKFTEAPGSVTMTVEQLTVFEDQSTLRFCIKDTGIGMDKEYIPKIFEPFSQEYSSRKTKYGSTGLGMAITKSIVEMMNGTINVESEKGVGTEFEVTVTLKISENKLTGKEYAIDPHTMHVLIVDDDEIACEHAQMVLEEVGVRSDISGSGAKALRMLEVQHTKQTPYNLVLMDWKMPGMDGIETSAKIRAEFGAETAIVILTEYNWDDIQEQAKIAGVDGFLTKPLFASSVMDEFERIARRNNISLFKEKKRAELAGRRLLLAEDIEINAEILMDILSLEDIETDHAENGRIVVDMFAKSEIGAYSAILMDVRMPEMDGLEAAAAIRAMDREDAKRIPIIALTANAFDEDVQRSLQAGMNAHLNKPVDSDHLIKILGELIYEAEQEE